MLICQLLLKNYFIHCYVETFLSCNIFFDILLVSVSFLQTYYDTYSSCILSFYFFLLQISFFIYLSPVLLISLYYFYINLLLYLVLRFGFFDKLNQRSHSFFYRTKKNYKKNYKTLPVFFICLIHTKHHLERLVNKVYHLLQKQI